VNYTPYQLRYLQVKYDPVPEGVLAPNLYFKAKDSVDVGEPLNFQVAFKNISDAAFDSMKVKYSITDQGNVKKDYTLARLRPMAGGDSLVVTLPIDTKTLPGKNTIYLDVNPDGDQLEQYHFNNFLFKDFYVRSDKYKPNLDVTFDGLHILNRDIVSAKPHVLVKLEDNNKYMKLDDTSLLKVQVRYPDNSLHLVTFDNVQMRFTPATGPAGTARNVAEIDYTPTFTEDGDYELIVSGKDKSGNPAGDLEYKVVFQVINKAMISNLLNYPNPFTTSTAFVFTLTGSEVPREFKIQILTVTGKIVREITREELGNIRIGRNITDFKWDGTDQFGQKLANGTYLYRVVTSLNGKSIDKYHAEGDLTDQYFKQGYGKMYLMR
jgi:FlgD Ig-like domain